MIQQCFFNFNLVFLRESLRHYTMGALRRRGFMIFRGGDTEVEWLVQLKENRERADVIATESSHHSPLPDRGDGGGGGGRGGAGKTTKDDPQR